MTITDDPRLYAADISRFFQRYAKGYSAGAFATPTAKELAEAPVGAVRDWRDGDHRTVVAAKRLHRDSHRKDWTGRIFTLPAHALVATHVARTPGSPIPDMDDYDYVMTYREDDELTAGLRSQGRRIRATRITAASELIAVWGRPGDVVARYADYDLATVAEMPFRVDEGTRRTILGELAAVNQWHDDYPFYCVTPDTEIMTADGWRTHDQITPGQQVLTLNHETGASEWGPLLRVNVFPARQQRMLRLEGKQHSSMTTLAHRWAVISRRYPHGETPTLTRRFVTSADLNRLDLIPTAAPCADLPVEPKHTDAFTELVAWFWTEGWVRADGSGGIAQSAAANPGHVTRIKMALAATFGPAQPRGQRTAAPAWYETPDTSNAGMVTFWLNRPAMATLTAVAPDKVVSTEFVRSLTRAQLELFIQTSVDADGTRPVKGSPLIYQKSRDRLDPISLAAALTGRTPGLYLNKANGIWSLILMERTTVNPVDAAVRTGGERATAEVVDYEGAVWCPTTPNGTWLARHNGKVFYTGNSDGTWGAVSLRGFNRHDPQWGVKPAEMPKTWKVEHPDALDYRCDWTVLADRCPAMRDVIEGVDWWAGLERVRLMQMAGRTGKPGKLGRHTDITDRASGTEDGQIVRFHIPLVTHPDIKMTTWDLDGKRTDTHLEPWRMYYLDARKPHSVYNPTPVNRVHLVADVISSPSVREHLAQAA